MVHGKKVVWISCGQAATGCSDPAAAAGEAAKALGWKYSIIDAKFDANGAWPSSILQAVAEKADAIIVHGVNCDLGKTALAAAKKAGVSVIATVGSLDCSITHDGPSLFATNVIPNAGSPTATSFFATYGAQKAAYIINKTHGQAKVIEMWLSDSDQAVHTGFVAEMKKCGGCSIVDSIPFTGASQTANGPLAQELRTAIQQHPEANALEISFDTPLGISGLGQALATIPAAKKMTITGGEGTPVGMDLLRSSNPLTAENGYDNGWIGWATMDALNRYFAHAPQVAEGFGTRLVDRQHNLNSTGAYQSPVDYKAAYAKIWK